MYSAVAEDNKSPREQPQKSSHEELSPVIGNSIGSTISALIIKGVTMINNN